MIRHSLNFITSGHGLREILEPVGFDAAEFVIEQEDSRKGRDVIYAGGDSKLKLYKDVQRAGGIDHCFDILKYNIDQYGFEAVIEYRVQFNDTEYVVGELSDMLYNGEYIEFTVVEKSSRALFKTRFDVPTDMFATETLDGLTSTPYVPTRILVKSKPIIAVSEWKMPGERSFTAVSGTGGEGGNLIRFWNFAQLQTKYDIKNSINYLSFSSGAQDAKNFNYIEAADSLKDIVINITNLTFYTTTGGLGSVNGFALRYFVGVDSDLDTGFEGSSVFNEDMGDNDSYSQIGAEYNINIPYASRGQKIYIYFSAIINASGGTYSFVHDIKSFDIKITATAIGYNTVVPAFRISDVMKYNAKLSAFLPVDCPRFDYGGEFYDIFITTQPLMRLLYDKQFNVTTKEIVEDFLPLFNGDYQIQVDDEIFYGIEDDFYRDYEIGNFTQDIYEYMGINGLGGGQIRGFERDTNPRYFIKALKLAFKNFASKREQTTDNTYDLVHGETQWLLPNKRAQNTKDIQIGWVFDPFLIEEARRNAYNLADKTATQDDDKKYAIDCVILTGDDRNQTETAALKHTFDDDNNRLVLTNNQSFSWLQLGILPLTTFVIETGDNEGSYQVVVVDDLQITLVAATGENSLVENTTFSYYIAPAAATYVNRTNEGFISIANIEDGENYGNLPFTAARAIRRFYTKYLATAIMYAKKINPDAVIKNTEYKNNPDATTWRTGEVAPIREGENFSPEGARLTPDQYKLSLIMTQQDFFSLQELQREQNGYIRTWNDDGVPLLGYVRRMAWTALNAGFGSDSLIGITETLIEEKYIPFLLTIFSDEGMTTVNGTVIPSGFGFDVKDNGKLHIFDANGKLLYPPVYYDRVRVNNSGQAGSTTDLIAWLNAL